MSAVRKAENNEALRVFLSYAAADRTQAQKLQRLLAQRPNVRIFTMEALSAGEDWESRLKEELSQCQVFILILSPNSVDSGWVLSELGAAWALDKPILPVITDPEVSSKLPLKVELRGVKPVELKDLEKPEVVNEILAHYEKAAASHKG